MIEAASSEARRLRARRDASIGTPRALAQSSVGRHDEDLGVWRFPPAGPWPSRVSPDPGRPHSAGSFSAQGAGRRFSVGGSILLLVLASIVLWEGIIAALRSTLFIAVLTATSLLLSTPAVVLAQRAAAPAPPESAVHDFHDYQPTEAQPSVVTAKQVDDEVKALLKQMDDLDRQFDHREGKDPSHK
jgi:hypothetical protein